MPTLPPDWLKIARIDADHFAIGVDQRSTAIARVDRGIGLNEIVIGTGADHPPFGADDARGDGMFQTERIADRHHPIANVQLARVAKLGEGQIAAGATDLDQGQVGAIVLADQARFILALIGQFYFDRVGAAHDMIIGQYLAVPADQNPRAQTARVVFPRRRFAEKPIKKIFDGIVGARARRALRSSRNIDHHRHGFFGDAGKGRRPSCRPRRRGSRRGLRRAAAIRARSGNTIDWRSNTGALAIDHV